MKKVGLVAGMVILFVLVALVWSFAQMRMAEGCKPEMQAMSPGKCSQYQISMTPHTGCCEMDGQMGMKTCRIVGAQGELGCCEREFFLRCKKELDFTDKQVEALKGIKMDFLKSKLRMEADLQITNLELQSLMEDEEASLREIESKLRSVEKLRTDMRLSHLKAFRKAKELLTPEQKEKMLKCREM
jgi:hypothetical protein